MLDELFASYVYKGGDNARRSNFIVETNGNQRVVSRYFKQQQKQLPLAFQTEATSSSSSPRPRSNDAIDCTESIVSRYFQTQKCSLAPQAKGALHSSCQHTSKNRLSSPQRTSNNDAEGSEREISRYFQHRLKNKSTPSRQTKTASSSSTLPQKTSPKCYVVQIDGIEKVVSPYFGIPKGAILIRETELARGKCPNEGGNSNSKRKRKRGNDGDDLKNSWEEDQDEVAVEVAAEDVNNIKRKRKRKQRSQLTAAEKKLEAYRRVPGDHNFRPPYSCHHLLQERHCYDPWRVLVISMLLNVTTGGQVAKVLSDFFSLCPDAETTTKVQVQDVENVIRSLGLQHARAISIKRFSSEYLKNDWTHVTQLHGVGKYAADAYATFCTGELEGVRPQDHKLVDYWKFVYPEKLADSNPSVQKVA